MVTIITPFTIAALLGLANGHMVMNTPTPYNLHNGYPLLQVNPLDDVIYPFPCQGLSTIEEVTPLTAGQTQLVNFTGGAQHGGGSCQFSLTYEYPPPADKTKWKTIYTLIGGCPVSAAGNLGAAAPDQDGRADSVHCGNDSGLECIRQFNIPIPKDVPSGNATFAWTWFNEIGNREVYMNCAPVSITGGSDSTAFFDSLPQMFVANIPGECTTNNGVLNIPNPGRFGKVLEEPAKGSTGTCPSDNPDIIPVFEGDGAPVPTYTNSTGPSTSPKVPPPTFTTSLPTTLQTVTRSSASLAAPVRPTPSGAAPLVPPPAPTQQPPQEAPAAITSCSPDGKMLCMGTTHFGICDHGRAVAQLLAAGTTCSDGVIARR